MMIRYITFILTILLMANTYAETEDEQVRFQLEQQFALADAEVQASRVANTIIGTDVSMEKQTTIVDEGGNLKIIDKDSPKSNNATEPRSVDSMPANSGQGPALTQPYTGPAPKPETPPPAAGKGSLQSSTAPELYEGQELTPEAAERGVAPPQPQPQPPSQPQPGQSMQAAPTMPSDGQSAPSSPSMPSPTNGTGQTPSQPMPVNPNQSNMQPNSPSSMPMPQGGNMPSAPPAVDQIR